MTIPRVAEFVALMFLALVLALLTLATRGGAPAPRGRKEKPPAMPPASCLMHWHGSQWRAEFRRGGSYSATDGHSHWRGTWRLEGRTLHVEEWLGEGGVPLRWDAEMGPHMRRGVSGWLFLEEQ